MAVFCVGVMARIVFVIAYQLMGKKAVSLRQAWVISADAF
jgi:hypothetical protein